MNTVSSCSQLSDRELRAALAHGVAAERKAAAHVIALLAEFDRRRLYLADGYRSLFVYCTDALHLSEDAAYTRIQAARASRKWPQLLDALRNGSMTLTAIALLAAHFNDANIDALVAEASHKRKEDVKLIVAGLAPKPDVASLVRKLPGSVAAQVAAPAGPVAALPAPRPSGQLPAPRGSEPAQQSAWHGSTNDAIPALAPAAAPITKPAVVAPLSAERYKIQITVDSDTREVLRQAQDLMRHSTPSGDPAAIISRALRVLVDNLLKKKMAATETPGRARTVENGSRTIPAAVRRDVWKRDRGQCAFDGARGRCGGRGALEYHHVIPYAMGGEATVENIELRCRAHNAYQADLDGLGFEHADVGPSLQS